MIQHIREAYNAHFSPERYEAFIEDLSREFDYRISFRVAETPIFVPRSLRASLLEAAEQIVDVITAPGYRQMVKDAIPPQYVAPNETPQAMCIPIDFGICRDENGELLPQLIELQGCPSLYCYQNWVAHKYREHFYVPEHFYHLEGGRNYQGYLDLLREAFIAGHKPENVVLLEVDPDNQNTRIDFLVTERDLGIRAVCISKVIREGRKLFYMRDGVKTPIHRIYNRVIFDDFVQRTDLTVQFHPTDDVEVEWVSHPNWYFLISKYTLPFLKNKYVPETHFVDQLAQIPDDLENWVLKPLFSFSGSGVVFDVTREDIDKLSNPHEYILQRKVKYEPLIQSPDGMVKCEIRLLYLWRDGQARPELVTNLARLSRGKLIGVKYNKDFDWVGGSVCFFEP